MSYSAIRTHEIHCGHRVVGHSGFCRNLHGHGYLFEFHCKSSELNELGMVIDFKDIKTKLCFWIEENWDHRMLIWKNDPLLEALQNIDSSVVSVDFNPTAENIAGFIVDMVAPKQLEGTGIICHKCVVYETRKCSVSYEK